MAQCPNCSKNIAISEDHFGTLYRCEHCSTEFFIGFDGVPENSKEAPIANDEPQTPMVTSNPSIEASEVAIDPMSMSMPTENSNNLFSIEPSAQTYMEPALTIPETSEPSVSVPNDIPVELPPTTNAFQNFASEVENFGNEVASPGILSFDVEISGIDLGDMKRDLLEALDDKRFGWNLEELKQSIKDGKLSLENISAPKIIVLVKRLTPIGLNVSWRHHVSTQ